MSLARIYEDENCLYLIQDISGYDTYDKSKAIVNFCDKETKIFEKRIDMAIIGVFERNGINIPNTTKSVLNVAFDLLKQKNKVIEIVDLFKNKQNDLCEFVKETKNHFVVMLETETICGVEKQVLQCGVEIKEKEYEIY